MENRTTSALLYLDAVSVSFDGFRALNNLSLTVEPGEMRAIIGPNGAGKTTMMDVITGKTRPDKGDVYFDGSHDLTKLDETQIAELGIGRKFQKPTVFDMHTVEDNLRLALKGERQARKTLLWRETASEQQRINEILGIIRLGAVRSRVAGSLSHGQKQWLEIGMLLAQDPKLLLVDEPVAGMTDVETHQTAELLKQIAQEKTVVVVEHDMTFVRELGVKVTCLHEGSVLAEGTIDQVSQNDRVDSEVYLGQLTHRIAGESDAMINLHYGAAQALRGISMKAEPGKVTCVLGRNGVGKTSLLDALMGQHPVSSGSIMWEGQDVTALKPADRARRGIAYVPQGREIFPLLTVEENLQTGFAPLKRDQRSIPDDVFSLFPSQQHAAAARWRSFRRAAAAACDRPRAGDAATAPAAR